MKSLFKFSPGKWQSITLAALFVLMTASSAQAEPPHVQLRPFAPGGIAIDWEHPNDGADSITLEREDPTFTWEFVALVNSFNDLGLQPSRVYRYRVCARYGQTTDCTQWLAAQTLATPPSYSPPAVPAFTSSSATANSITVTWTSSPSYSFHQVRWAENGRPDGQTRVDGRSFTANGLRPGTYHFIVQGCNRTLLGSSCSHFSAPIFVAARVPAPPPEKPNAPGKPQVTAIQESTGNGQAGSKTPFRLLVRWAPPPAGASHIGWYSVDLWKDPRWIEQPGRYNPGSSYEGFVDFPDTADWGKRQAVRVCAQNALHKTCSPESWYYAFAAPQDRAEAEVNAQRSVPVIKGTGSTTLEGGAGTRASSINPPVSATEHEAVAAKGEAIANQDPLSIELRNRQPEGSARRGFDIGMAAAEGQTQDGPNKKRMHDSLPAAEQSGFRTAVAFSLERNKNAAFASKGAVIAAQDPMVADARMAEGDVFYWL
ncbi:MAG: fibronectin type III domain-containing protein, partial [Pyrinomonadaceae bacterium]|nr:fibronectin type III domain-containing protein [Pyrinomonadaceae bacterium]